MDGADRRPPAGPGPSGYVKPQQLWQRFEWISGSCFRCERLDVEVTVIGSIAVGNVEVEIHACRKYVFRLEQLHWALIGRQSQPLAR
ncbi:hypothetical protein [Streptomyces sp. SHP 1-2]|uniref:hypothetical protein n=1 Tax=Streptomyces sp. SHP 1-2 TaxID=2769489 RepID=UPI002AA2B596|nr:hypothetical protein [Streptomyces sp. SHP 1-2]